MRRILVIAAGYPSEKSFSGAFHRDQLRIISQAGYKITVVAPTPWVPPFFDKFSNRWQNYFSVPRLSTDGDVEVIRPRYLAIPREMSCSYPDLMQFLAILKLRLPRPDLIQGFYGFPNGGAARLIAKYWGIPYFIGLLGDDVNLYPYLRPRNLSVLTSVVRDAKIAFANGPSLAKEASRITGYNIRNIPIGVNSEIYSQDISIEESRAILGLPQHKKIALYVGSLVPAKGINEILEAINILNKNDFVTVFIGEGPLQELINRESKAIWLGVLTPSKIAIAMKGADFLVHPSYSEGLPTVIVEAGFSKLPVITTDARGCLDIGMDNRAVVIPARNSNALAEAIKYALENSQIMSDNAQRMYSHVQENYSLSSNTNVLISHYRSCLTV